MSVMHVAFGNKEKFPKNIFNGNCLSWRPKDVTLQVSLLDAFRTFTGRFSKLSEYSIINV